MGHINIMNYINSKNVNADLEFPYLVLNRKNNMTFPVTPGFHVYHWHKDLQFVYVLSGNVCIKTLEKEEYLSAGEGAFINSNVVHIINTVSDCDYKCFIFPEYLVSFYTDSPVMKMTQSVTTNTSISLVRLSKEKSWCPEALKILKKLVQLENSKTTFYHCEVLANISMLWVIILKNLNISEFLPANNETIRVRKILAFIETHYAEEISLARLAESADISTSEALRCFKLTLQTTPYRYLMDFRLAKAENLLKDTNLPISQIASLTGFSQQAYFGKCFREKMNCSPREYRKRKFHNSHMPDSLD